ncbi:MAG: HAD hydrolase-like protein [Lachnospiraceae bacterium]|jgi:phosphoglycolate phosphatase
MYKSIIFDIDGTLADTTGRITEAALAGFEAIGIDEADNSMLRAFSVNPIRKKYSEYTDGNEELTDIAVKAFRQKYEESGFEGIVLYDGIENVLSSLKAEGKNIGVVSSRGIDETNELLSELRIAKYVDEAVCSSVFEGECTKADLVAEACVILDDGSDGKTLFVGDRFYDVEAGKEAGVDTMGVLYGNGALGEVEESSPDLICETTSDIVDKILKNDYKTRMKHSAIYPNGYIYKASAGKKIWDVIYPILIYVGLDYFVSVVVMAVLAFIGLFGPGDIFYIMSDVVGSFSIPLTFVVYIMSIAVFIPILENDRKVTGLYGNRKLLKLPGVKNSILLVLIGFASSVAINLIIVLTGLNRLIESVDSRTILFSQSFPVELVLMCIAAPIAEEILFRGILFNRLRRSLAFLPAALIVSAAFGVLHMEIVTAVTALIFGMIMAYIYEITQSLAATIVMHAAFNFFPVLVNSLDIGITVLGCMIAAAAGCVIAGISIVMFKKSVTSK